MGRERLSNNLWVSGALIVILAFLIFFVPSYGWKIRTWLSPAIGDQAAAPTPQTESQMLSAENDALKAQLATFQVIAREMPTSSPAAIRAMVYSRYPMNFRNELLVSAGSNDGVAVGAAAVFQGMLLGQVSKVFPNEALVTTIFDNSFKMPVRIGSTGANGLLQGGSYPTIGSIATNARIMPNDIVYSAVAGIPYAIPVAEVIATSTSPDSLFQQATLDFPYDVNNVETVFITK